MLGWPPKRPASASERERLWPRAEGGDLSIGRARAQSRHRPSGPAEKTRRVAPRAPPASVLLLLMSRRLSLDKQRLRRALTSAPARRDIKSKSRASQFAAVVVSGGVGGLARARRSEPSRRNQLRFKVVLVVVSLALAFVLAGARWPAANTGRAKASLAGRAAAREKRANFINSGKNKQSWRPV